MSSPPVRAPLLLLAAAACLCSRPAFAQDIPNSIAGHELPKWVPPALATAFILVGLAELSIGYKFFRLTLFALGRLTGDVRTARLSIADGAVFRGRIEMG